LLILAVTGFLYAALVSNLEREDQQLLADEFEWARALLLKNPNDLSELTHRLHAETSVRQHFRFFVRVLDVNGKTIAESPGMAATLPTQLVERHVRGARSAQFETTNPEGRSFEVLVRQVLRDDSDAGWMVQVAMDRTFEEELLSGYRKALVVVLALALVLCALVGYQIARRGLRPLQEMTATVSRIHSTTLDERVRLTGLPAELSLLAATFNQMLDRLEESFSRLSRFSADIAHELRTPVNNLRGETEVALGKPRTAEEYREALESCLEECSRLSRIIDSLLFLARAEEAKLPVLNEPVDLKRELQSVQEFYEPVASEAGVRITLQASEGVIANLDRTLLQRALGNLVSNALRHTPPGGQICLTARTANGELQIDVADTGSGIAPEHLPHVFDRFYRADAARSSIDGGVGLGLAIVRSIAQLHGGTAEIRSHPGRGTCVTLTLKRENSGRPAEAY
jgi:two-component system heavy metal sensor histidine kinase CusS